MDQQNNRAVPDEPAEGGRPHQAGAAAEGQGRPQSQWEVFAGNPDSPQAPSGWEPPRITESQPSRDWAVPWSGQPAGWGEYDGYQGCWRCGRDQRAGGPWRAVRTRWPVRNDCPGRHWRHERRSVRVTALMSSDSYTAQTILLATASGTAAAPGAGTTIT